MGHDQDSRPLLGDVQQEKQGLHEQQEPQREHPPEYQPANSVSSASQAGLGAQKIQKRSLEKEPQQSASSAGASSSTAPADFFTTSFASLSLHMSDRIRLMDFPQPIISLVRLALQRVWQRGIQAECTYYGSYEFKLRGNPWYPSYALQSIDARRLVRHLFEVLYDAGWVLALSTDVSRKQADKDTLIFRHQTPSPARCDWLCVDFARGDRIRIMDAPQALLDAVYSQLQPTLQERVMHRPPGVWEIKMKGYPWNAMGGETMTARRVLLLLFAVLERFGFSVYASVDQESTHQDHRSETDTWHCLRPVGWTPGAPVYHA